MFVAPSFNIKTVDELIRYLNRTLIPNQHCIDAILQGKADAVLAASIFHFKEIEINLLK